MNCKSNREFSSELLRRAARKRPLPDKAGRGLYIGLGMLGSTVLIMSVALPWALVIALIWPLEKAEAWLRSAADFSVEHFPFYHWASVFAGRLHFTTPAEFKRAREAGVRLLAIRQRRHWPT